MIPAQSPAPGARRGLRGSCARRWGRICGGALATIVLAGCPAHVQTYHRCPLYTHAGAFWVQYAEEDRSTKEQIEEAVRRASRELDRWGGLEEPVTVHVLPSHEALEQAAESPGYPFTRAWTRYDEVFVQSPRTWTIFRASQREVDEVILHELTHAVMYQQAANRTHWRRKGIPGWFREGMASFTADQGFRWSSLEDLARFYEANPSDDPVGDQESLYQHQYRIAYGAAHHAFAFLVRRYGVERVRGVLAAMKEERTFEEAFEHTLGLSQDAFEKDFKRYVRLRGFRGGPIRPHLVPKPVPDGE